ncbi:hypothetical protein OSB04_022133 [Centaurea solstitialis]|uniref:Uncharacterized protein n=1 Tax=Centaurea solstitialis TaxID=347529 RepID=A0AA38WEV1_9ASTR|nr:hypothetical protein OSB04_022133 [Centaurea solstitialis]
MYAKLRIMRYHSSSTVFDMPKGHCSIYVGESNMKRFVIPLAYVQHPSFQTLLNFAEEELDRTRLNWIRLDWTDRTEQEKRVGQGVTICTK